MHFALLTALFFVTTAHAGESCLTAEEKKELVKLRSSMTKKSMMKSGCDRVDAINALGCPTQQDQLYRLYLEEREQGKESACMKIPDQKEIDSVGAEEQP